MKDCIFCKIIKGEIPSQKVFENESVLAFKDLHPQARIHLLFVPKHHSSSALDINMHDVSSIFQAIQEWARDQKMLNGFRVVTNVGPDGGQSVFHTHFHVLAGEKLSSFGA